jgi:LysM repeat protein
MRTTVRLRQLSVRLSMTLVPVITVFLLIGGSAGAETPPPSTIDYVVRSGDTLWAIASSHVDPDEDVRLMVETIKTTSGIASSTLHPGQVLQIPRT